MVEVDANHYQIVKDSLAGKRAVDEQTFASMTILNERLQRLKNLDKSFNNVTLSPAAKKLKSQGNMVAVR